jgi:hypothetical protein
VESGNPHNQGARSARTCALFRILLLLSPSRALASPPCMCTIILTTTRAPHARAQADASTSTTTASGSHL